MVESVIAFSLLNIIIIYWQGPANIIQTLDNPLVLEQQLEALEHHKKVMDRREQYERLVRDDENHPRGRPTSTSSVDIEKKKMGSFSACQSNDTVIYSNTNFDSALDTIKKPGVVHTICHNVNIAMSDFANHARNDSKYYRDQSPHTSASKIIRHTTVSIRTNVLLRWDFPIVSLLWYYFLSSRKIPHTRSWRESPRTNPWWWTICTLIKISAINLMALHTIWVCGWVLYLIRFRMSVDLMDTNWSQFIGFQLWIYIRAN